MSGIVGIVPRGGAPLDRPLLGALTDFLSYCGPDAQASWGNGRAGFGHAMLRTTDEAQRERQPVARDGRFFITADARLDRRTELIDALAQAGEPVSRAATEPELILASYVAWGEACVDRLFGDFSFAIWDDVRRVLFCARDHFGQKPFYYVERRDAFVFSNSLECLRLYPGVTSELNEAAIADFLLYGLNRDEATTTFRDIRRLPPAHALALSESGQGGVQTRRYWWPPVDGRIRYKNPQDYIEHFRTVFGQAVADRLRTDSVGIWMSGGLDSTTMAATAKEVSVAAGRDVDLRAYTNVYDRLIPDQERFFAGEAAKFIGIPIEFFALDDLPLFDRDNDPDVAPPEPVDAPLWASGIDVLRKLSAGTRVLLDGEGDDNLSDFQMWPHVKDMARHGEWFSVLGQGSRFLWVRPFPWKGIKNRAKRLFSRGGSSSNPDWLAPEFRQSPAIHASLCEEGRWPKPPRAHPVFPRGHASMLLPHWANTFETEQPAFTRCTVETRYPFLDLRVANFLQALPAFPWAFRKQLVRKAMEGRLPQSTLRRPKTPVQGDPFSSKLRVAVETGEIAWHPQITRFIDCAKLEPLRARRSSNEAGFLSSTLALNFWLRSSLALGYKLNAEVRYA